MTSVTSITTSEREDLVSHLNALGTEDDAHVLASARAISEIAERLELDWGGLIGASAEDDRKEEEAAVTPLPPGTTIETVIDTLIALPTLSLETQSDLREFADQATSGTLDEGDRRFILALAKRLGLS